jgi:hypothetical protein
MGMLLVLFVVVCAYFLLLLEWWGEVTFPCSIVSSGKIKYSLPPAFASCGRGVQCLSEAVKSSLPCLTKWRVEQAKRLSEPGKQATRASDRLIAESNVIVAREDSTPVCVEHLGVVAQSRSGDTDVSAAHAL